MPDPKITKIETVIFEHDIQDMGTDYNGFNLVYEKGNVHKMQSSILRIHTSTGVIGESTGRNILPNVANYVLGKNPSSAKRYTTTSSGVYAIPAPLPSAGWMLRCGILRARYIMLRFINFSVAGERRSRRMQAPTTAMKTVV